MQDNLKVILDIQEFDIKMIRLMKLKKARKKELSEIDDLKKDLSQKIETKEEEIQGIKEESFLFWRTDFNSKRKNQALWRATRTRQKKLKNLML